jgi:hypothetical protein
VNYRTLLGSLTAIVSITLVIIGLSINHHHQEETVVAVGSPASTASLSGISAAVMTPVLLASSDKSIDSGGHCNIERIDGGLFTGSASHARTLPIEFSGWVVDPATKSVPTDVGIRIELNTNQQVWIVPLTAGINRPDVLATLGNDQGYLRSGFSVRINPIGLPDGDYRILIQYRSGGSPHVCDNGRKLKIGG